MRRKLKTNNGVRKKFHAVFSRLGKKVNYRGYQEETVLLTTVCDAVTGELLADHLWFAFTKGFQKLALRPGMAISFEARIKAYEKGYVNKKYKIDERRVDYKLSHPTHIGVSKDEEG